MKNAEFYVDFYRQLYQRPEFVRVYKEARHGLYRRIAAITRALGVTYALDIGCSVGLLVEYLRQEGISSWGADFDLPQLRAAHADLPYPNKFFYGDAAKLDIPIPRWNSAIIMLDTFRYMSEPRTFGFFGAQYIIIKEVSRNPFMLHKRKGQNDLALYTPAELAALFPAYQLERIYASRFIFSVSRPNPLTLAAFNLLPTYTVVLKHQ